jgi:hypothetical protein
MRRAAAGGKAFLRELAVSLVCRFDVSPVLSMLTRRSVGARVLRAATGVVDEHRMAVAGHANSKASVLIVYRVGLHCADIYFSYAVVFVAAVNSKLSINVDQDFDTEFEAVFDAQCMSPPVPCSGRDVEHGEKRAAQR